MGKFESDRAEAIYRASLDGGADTVGDVQFGTHYARVVDWIDPESTDENGYEFDGDYIVAEDSAGFVTLLGPFDIIDIGRDGYYSPSDAAWAECVAEWDSFYGDDDDDEDERSE